MLAWHWRDPVMTHELLDDLLNDRRDGRAGFAKAIAFELRRLRDFIERRGNHEPDSQPAQGILDALRCFWSKH